MSEEKSSVRLDVALGVGPKGAQPLERQEDLFEELGWSASLAEDQLREGRRLVRYRRHLLAGGLSVALAEDVELFGGRLPSSLREVMHTAARDAALSVINERLSELEESFRQRISPPLPPLLPLSDAPPAKEALEHVREERGLYRRLLRVSEQLAQSWGSNHRQRHVLTALLHLIDAVDGPSRGNLPGDW